MTREEQLKSCTICTHRCMDMHKGLLCGLTNEFADFESSYPNFEQDEKEIQKQEYKRHGYKHKKERNLAFTDYDDEAIRAAREYAEGLFTPEEVKDPSWEDSIDSYAVDFEEGADWYKLNRGASYEEVQEAANQYGRKIVANSDANFSTTDMTRETDDYLDAVDGVCHGIYRRCRMV